MYKAQLDRWKYSLQTTNTEVNWTAKLELFRTHIITVLIVYQDNLWKIYRYFFLEISPTPK